MSRVLNLQARHLGQRCVLVANGPSLNRMDLGFLRNEVVIGLNKIYLGLRRFRFYPRYFVAVNPLVIRQARDEILAMNCVKFLGDAAADGVLGEDALTYLLNTRQPPARFSRDIAAGIHEGWTVTYAALQVAYYLGFQEVVIIGMDHRYQFVGSPNEAKTLEGEDLNHFDPAYFGGGQLWHNPDLSHSEESYRIARAEFEAQGRRIVDATLDGACEIFEKADYRAVFGLEE